MFLAICKFRRIIFVLTLIQTVVGGGFLTQVIGLMSNLGNNMSRKQNATRLTIHNRNLRYFNSDGDANSGSGERWENPRRDQKSGSKTPANNRTKIFKGLRTKDVVSFGPDIPDDVLDDLCFRFLINIPEDQKKSPVRLCFQIELAHWFYIDFYYKGNTNERCPDVSLRDLIGQIFSHCDFLVQYTGSVDKVLEEWRIYKSAVPTYGAMLLDSSLNYVLLVQGYFSKNSWGFPKGKINEGEEPEACASREVMEEVGFDISDKISETHLVQCFVNETLIRLYIVRNVPVDFPFAPNTRKEIGKIQWFCIWDLPKDRNDLAACERIGMSPSCFYTVIPFVRELQAYVSKHRKTHNKPSQMLMNAANISACSSSAFSPVQRQQVNETLPPALSLLFNSTSATKISTASQHSFQHESPHSPFFKPVTSSVQRISYTGTTFLQMVSVASRVKATYVKSAETVGMNEEVTRPVPTIPRPAEPILGRPVYNAFKNEAERKAAASLQRSHKASPNSISYHGVKEVTSRGADKKTFVNSNNNFPGRKNISPPYRNPEKRNKNSYLKGDDGVKRSVPNYMSDDSQLVNLCKAWKNFKVSNILFETDITFQMRAIFFKRAESFRLMFLECTENDANSKHSQLGNTYQHENFVDIIMMYRYLSSLSDIILTVQAIRIDDLL
ncbi:unnamed protein product [Litomosoides sigmodontis]|uniref:mRNA-decapping enzyme 2 n=1 Tax=Litomosoides sigmodontis TaxID=42156 RepID=A0A3P6VAE2_LITSI|nr:unnamed protein product [Litomosoides sigmodontis]